MSELLQQWRHCDLLDSQSVIIVMVLQDRPGNVKIEDTPPLEGPPSLWL